MTLNQNVINIGAGISGEYRLVVTKPDGTVSTDTGWFKNLIVNQGLDRIGNGGLNPIFNYCRVGTGNSTPAVTQTSLDAQIAASNAIGAATSNTNEGAPLYRTTLVNTCVFPQGSVIGNITEVGIGWATTGTTLFSRALILDNLGFPTSITLVAIDQLTVYYRVRIVPPLTDFSGSVTISGTPYNYTSRVASVGSFGNIQYLFTYDYFSSPGTSSTYAAGATLGAITAFGPTGTQSGTAGSVSNGSYTNGNYYKDSNWSWSITQGLATGGIQAIRFSWGQTYQPFGFQVRFDTPIPKTNTNVLTLTMRFTWFRV